MPKFHMLEQHYPDYLEVQNEFCTQEFPYVFRARTGTLRPASHSVKIHCKSINNYENIKRIKFPNNKALQVSKALDMERLQ